MASFRLPGSKCAFRVFPEFDDGTLCLHAAPSSRPLSGYSLWPDLHDPELVPAMLGMNHVIGDLDRTEFKIVKRMPVMSRRKRAYATVNEYVADRTFYFGSPSAYTAFAAESDAELANTRWIRKKKTRTLRSMIEFNKRGQESQQRIFYRWVRKAYQRKYGEDVNVPEMIRKGMSKELEEALTAVRGSVRVKEAGAGQFNAGGFNPRPVKQPRPGQKKGKNYILGTLSEHGTGMAVDIDDKRNAQLSAEEWAFIEKLTGKSVSRANRWKTETDAEGLWTDIKSLSDLFVAKVASEVKRIEKERADKEKAAKEKAAKEAKPGATVSPPAPAAKAPSKSPLEEVLGKHHSSLSPWVKDGFFALPLELVLELHAHGFIWGACAPRFGTPDLHHFELDQ